MTDEREDPTVCPPGWCGPFRPMRRGSACVDCGKERDEPGDAMTDERSPHVSR